MNKQTLRLDKEEKADGTIWYKVWYGSECLKCFMEKEQSEALKYYNEVKEKAKSSLPKTTTIISEEV